MSIDKAKKLLLIWQLLIYILLGFVAFTHGSRVAIITALIFFGAWVIFVTYLACTMRKKQRDRYVFPTASVANKSNFLKIREQRNIG